MKRLSTFVFILSFMMAQSGFAETPIGETYNPATSSSNSGAGTNKTAKSSSGGAATAMVSNTIAAGGFIVAARATTDPVSKTLFYAMAAASVASGFMMSGGSKNANAVDSATFAMPSTGRSFSNTPGAGFETGSGVYEDLVALEKELEKEGYRMSADGSSISTPSGELSTAALASGKAPGFEMNDNVKETIAAIAEDAMKKASGNRVVPIGLQDGGGGGGSGYAAAEESSSKFDMSKYLKGLKNRDPSSVTGLSKKLGDDNIGIQSDNIFEMVSRQYKRKQSQSAFIK